MTPIPTDDLVAARNKANYEQGILDGLLKQLISNGTQRGALNARIERAIPHRGRGVGGGQGAGDRA